MKASENNKQSLNAGIASFLANYSSTPHATTGVSPNQHFREKFAPNCPPNSICSSLMYMPNSLYKISIMTIMPSYAP